MRKPWQVQFWIQVLGNPPQTSVQFRPQFPELDWTKIGFCKWARNSKVSIRFFGIEGSLQKQRLDNTLVKTTSQNTFTYNQLTSILTSTHLHSKTTYRQGLCFWMWTNCPLLGNGSIAISPDAWPSTESIPKSQHKLSRCPTSIPGPCRSRAETWALIPLLLN